MNRSGRIGTMLAGAAGVIAAPAVGGLAWPGARHAIARRPRPWRSPPRTGSSNNASPRLVGSISGSSSGARTARTRCCWSCTAGRAGPTRSSPAPATLGAALHRHPVGPPRGGQDPGPQRQGRQRPDDLRPEGRRRHRGHRVPALAPGHRQGGRAGRIHGHGDRPGAGQAPARPVSRLGGHRPVREHGRQRGPQTPTDPGAAAGRRHHQGRGRPAPRPCCSPGNWTATTPPSCSGRPPNASPTSACACTPARAMPASPRCATSRIGEILQFLTVGDPATGETPGTSRPLDSNSTPTTAQP
jgi:hypothetical protein